MSSRECVKESRFLLTEKVLSFQRLTDGYDMLPRLSEPAPSEVALLLGLFAVLQILHTNVKDRGRLLQGLAFLHCSSRHIRHDAIKLKVS